MRTTTASLLLAGLLCGCSSDGGDPDPQIDATDVIAPPFAEWSVDLEDYEGGAFLSVWGRAQDDVYVAGGVDEQGVLLHFDGLVWSEESLPEGTPLLHWVFGVDDELWVVGREGTAMRRVGHGAWSDESLGTEEPLWGIWGAQKDAIYTVGGDETPAGQPVTEGLVFRWDGAAWNPEFPPELPDGPPDAFYKVWGTSEQDVVVVGSDGAVLTWDGGGWGAESVSPFRDLVSLWGGAGTWLVSGGRQQPVLLERHATGWAQLDTSSVLGAGLNGTWVEQDGERAYSVGVAGAILRVELETGAVLQESAPTARALHGVFGFDDGVAFAVGGHLVAGNLHSGVILRRTEMGTE